ncbi:MAG: histidine phosphatase family protein [Paucibacter sp.]|nr:histidine phosphatase family protein [Roseateles sp.]
MGLLTLVRHGQASFGADDYDRLSELGERQCRLLGQYWRERGKRFSAVLVGTLKRHQQSLEAIRMGLIAMPEALAWPGLNEFDSEALIRAYLATQGQPGELKRPASVEEVRQYFRLLREGLRAWMAGQIEPVGMPSHAEFAAGVAGALAHVRERCEGEVLIVSSGGPISTAVAQVLGAPYEAAVEMNLQLRNSALTEFVFNARKHTLQSFNHLPHLDAAGLREMVSYT